MGTARIGDPRHVRTLYRTLGVGPEAPPADVRHAYRRLVRLHHPDAGADPREAAALAAVVTAYRELGRLGALVEPPRRGGFDGELVDVYA